MFQILIFFLKYKMEESYNSLNRNESSKQRLEIFWSRKAGGYVFKVPKYPSGLHVFTSFFFFLQHCHFDQCPKKIWFLSSFSDWLWKDSMVECVFSFEFSSVQMRVAHLWLGYNFSETAFLMIFFTNIPSASSWFYGLQYVYFHISSWV